MRVVEHPLSAGNLLVVADEQIPPPAEPDTGPVAWFVPYTNVLPPVVNAAPAGATWIDVSGHPHAYHAALAHIWERGESFAVLEHDVACRPDVVEAFETCPEPWCVYAYSDFCHPECREGWRNLLGCTRFRAELIRAVPDAVSSITDPGLLDWHNVCDGTGENLRAAGFTHHWHEPAVLHRHHLPKE